jgi:hypothetical protein
MTHDHRRRRLALDRARDADVSEAGEGWSDSRIAGDARYLRKYEGAALNALAGEALFVGPTLFATLGYSYLLTAAFGSNGITRQSTAAGSTWPNPNSAFSQPSVWIAAPPTNKP